MKRLIVLALMLACSLVAQAQHGKKNAPQSSSAAKPYGSKELEEVLTQMDASAARFRSAEATFEWDQYQKVVDETDVQKGVAFFVRHEKDTHMSAMINSPEKKQIVYDSGKIRLFQPKIDQITEYDAGKSKEEVESFLVLGFGGRGHDLPKSFEVKLAGWEQMQGIKTARLELTPKQDKIRNMFARFVLWVDTTRDISLKQQAFEPSGDYRIAKYSDIKLNVKIPEQTFKIKSSSSTKIVRP